MFHRICKSALSNEKNILNIKVVNDNFQKYGRYSILILALKHWSPVYICVIDGTKTPAINLRTDRTFNKLRQCGSINSSRTGSSLSDWVSPLGIVFQKRVCINVFMLALLVLDFYLQLQPVSFCTKAMFIKFRSLKEAHDRFLYLEQMAK